MKILIIDNLSQNTQGIAKFLKKENVEYTIAKYNQLSNLDYSDINAIILTGSSELNAIWDIDKLKDEIDLILTTTLPVLGICFGFELICKVYKSTLVENREIKGLRQIQILQTDPILKGLPNLVVKESHKWCVTEIGDELLGIAKSETGFEIIKHKTKPIYGFQFHPELLPDETVGDELLRNFLKIAY